MGAFAIDKKFFDSVGRLGREAGKLIDSFIVKFMREGVNGGMNFEKVNGSYKKLLRTVRVNDKYRVVLMLDDLSNAVLLHAAEHDDAYRWAERRGCEVNARTGELQVFTVEVEETAPRTAAPRPEIQTGLFASKLSDHDLLALGVPEPLISQIRQIADEDDLLGREESFPQGVFDILLKVADGKTVPELLEAIREDRPEAQPPSDNVADAISSNLASQGQFVFVSNEEELNAVRNASLAKWRVYLHASQRKIVQKRTRGPVKVLGGAGTGKTVVAMHRAKFLLENVFVNGERLLFTTFTRNLCSDIKRMLASICSEAALGRIDVVNLDQWALGYLRKQKVSVNPIMSDEKRREIMEKALDRSAYDGPLDAAFFLREWVQIVLANRIASEADYLRVPRIGQGTRIPGKDRKAIWSVFEQYRSILRTSKMMEPDEIMDCAAQLVEKDGRGREYASVIVDETQDFSMPALRLVCALSGNRYDACLPDSLMLVGDAHQRIYGRRAILNQCGINVRGRSSKLYLNYRSTEQIRRFAVALLEGVPVDDLDGESDNNKGYRSLVVGAKPEHGRFDGFEEEMDAVAQKLQTWTAEDNRPLCDYAVLCRTREEVLALGKALRKRNLDSLEIKTDDEDGAMPGSVRIATMHRAKGLEFVGVVLPRLNPGVWPLKPAGFEGLDRVAQRTHLAGELSLLYVAITRAMKHVCLTGVGAAPSELPALQPNP